MIAHKTHLGTQSLATSRRGVSRENVVEMGDGAVHAPLFPGKSNAGLKQTGLNYDRVLRELAKTGATLKLLHAEDHGESCFSHRRCSNIEPTLDMNQGIWPYTTRTPSPS